MFHRVDNAPRVERRSSLSRINARDVAHAVKRGQIFGQLRLDLHQTPVVAFSPDLHGGTETRNALSCDALLRQYQQLLRHIGQLLFGPNTESACEQHKKRCQSQPLLPQRFRFPIRSHESIQRHALCQHSRNANRQRWCCLPDGCCLTERNSVSVDVTDRSRNHRN